VAEIFVAGLKALRGEVAAARTPSVGSRV